MTTLAEIRPIRTEEDHRRALEIMEGLWAAEPGTDDYDRLDVLATLVEAYEARRWPITEMDPIEAIAGAIESGEHTRAELAELIGQSRATEVLKRKRYLTLPMIRQIAGKWGLPADTLVKNYNLVTTGKTEKRTRYHSTRAEAVAAVAGKPARTATGDAVKRQKAHTFAHAAKLEAKRAQVARSSPKPKNRPSNI